MTEAVLAQLYAIRAQIDAAIITAQSGVSQPAPIDPTETCPNCGASGETQLEITSLADRPTRRFRCRTCSQERSV